MKKKKNVRKPDAKNKFGGQNRVAMIVITFVLCVLLSVLLVEGNRLSGRIDSNNQRVTQLEQQLAEENERTEEISQMQDEMQSDEYLEKIAKERLGLIKDNEIVFKETK